MRLRKLALAPIAAAAMMAFSIPASALTSESWLLNFAADSNMNPGPFGTVTATETSATTVDVNVTLAQPSFKFVETGGPHDAFAFNLASDGTAGVVSNLTTGFVADGSGVNTPFGTFSNLIMWTGGLGGGNGTTGPLNFTVTDAGGITVNSFIASTNPGLTTPAGTIGWLFSADIIANGFTGNVATNINTPAIPEPETYAMMLVGFGLLGFVARRRKQILGSLAFA